MTIWLSKPRKIFRRLVDLALFRSVFLPGKDRYPNSKPGDLIKKLTPEERKELEKLTSKEIHPDFLPL